MDVDADVADVAQDVAVLALRDRGADVAAQAPVQEPQIVFRIAVDLDATKLVDALAVLQEIAGERDAPRDFRQREILPGQHVERLPARLGMAQGIPDLRDLIGPKFVDPVARRREVGSPPSGWSFDDLAHGLSVRPASYLTPDSIKPPDQLGRNRN